MLFLINSVGIRYGFIHTVIRWQLDLNLTVYQFLLVIAVVNHIFDRDDLDIMLLAKFH
ncbi:hypothetical protein D3C73_1653320 [compost metagenome]